jgi:hypothetical protein
LKQKAKGTDAEELDRNLLFLWFGKNNAVVILSRNYSDEWGCVNVRYIHNIRIEVRTKGV